MSLPLSEATVIQRGVASEVAGHPALPRIDSLVKIQLEVRTDLFGRIELFNTVTGQGCGVCSSAAVAEKTKAFFA